MGKKKKILSSGQEPSRREVLEELERLRRLNRLVGRARDPLSGCTDPDPDPPPPLTDCCGEGDDDD